MSSSSTSPISPDTLAVIAEAFSRTAEKYDAFAEDHPHLSRMREKVYAHIARLAAPGASILELNCGTGTDAVRLAGMGYRVHATDIAPGMLARLEEKAARLGLEGRITRQTCAFFELDKVSGGPYDVVFSNLGGLNCTPDLPGVAARLPRVLKPGGIAIFVLMPRVCLWEIATVFAGQFRLAFRRFARGGTQAHLEGLYFPVYYFHPREAERSFGRDFSRLALEGLSVITPTAESKNLARRWPRLYSALAWLDDRLAPRWPWRGWGDFYILSMRYQPGER
jgi:ubiquinone/menaquinone biosynthesis C-methylase UbiE